MNASKKSTWLKHFTSNASDSVKLVIKLYLFEHLCLPDVFPRLRVFVTDFTFFLRNCKTFASRPKTGVRAGRRPPELNFGPEGYKYR